MDLSTHADRFTKDSYSSNHEQVGEVAESSLKQAVLVRDMDRVKSEQQYKE